MAIESLEAKCQVETKSVGAVRREKPRPGGFDAHIYAMQEGNYGKICNQCLTPLPENPIVSSKLYFCSQECHRRYSEDWD